MSNRRPYVDLVQQIRRSARGIAGVTDAWVTLEPRGSSWLPPAGTPPRYVPGAQPAGRADLPQALVHGDPFELPAGAPSTLVDALINASTSDKGTTYILADGQEERQTYRQLLEDAARFLAGLRSNGVLPGESVLLHCDDNRNFVTGFWACVLGGFVPTPIAIAPTYRSEHATNRRIRDAWELLDRPPVLTDRRMVPRVAELRRLWDTQALVVLGAEDVREDRPAADLFPADPEHPVVHLLTSGSTGVPKCVRHVHRTVVTRAYVNAAANDFGPADVTLNFMPLDHVAGMVMHNLRDVVLVCEHVNARIDSFMADPLRWLTWIERHRVTNTAAPNFVITLVTKLADEIARGRWDLSSLRDITNGGEAIVSRTTHEFLGMLAPHGLRQDVMRPAWGMSEMCGGVVHSTLRGDDESAGVVTIDRWEADGSLTFLAAPAPGHPTFTEVGRPAPGTSVRIVDADDSVLPEDRVGRLQVRGPTRMVGYYKNPAADAASSTADGWFDTGDLGFVHGGRLVMTGRDKEILVIRSTSYPCHEVESVVERVDGVLPTFVAACSEPDPETGTDELVVFCVLVPSEAAARRAVVREIARRLGAEMGLSPRFVIPLERDAFPKTSAGKVERRRLLADYHAGTFDPEIAEVSAIFPRVASPRAEGLFATVWSPVPEVPGPLPRGPWVIFDGGGLADGIRALAADTTVVAVRPGPAWERHSGVEYRIDPAECGHYDELLAAVRRDHGDVGVVVHGWAIAPTDGRRDDEDLLERSALSVHRVMKVFGGVVSRLMVLTAGACAIDEQDVVEPLHATVNGLVRTANAEYDTTFTRQLDLPTGGSDPVPRVLAELADTGEHDVVALRAGGRMVPRLRPLPASPREPAHGIRPGGLYLVTGGLGRIGSRIAQSLLTRHAAKVVLNGRSTPAGERAERLASLQALGEVRYLRADVADAAALRDGVEAAEQHFGRPLDGVIHLAGADIAPNWENLKAHLLANEDTAEFRRMYRAKVLGTLAVARMLADRPDALLIVASSVNGYFGGTAFGAYSSANSFLPAFVEAWRRSGRSGQCHAWSFWVEGAAGTGGRERAIVEHRGFRPIESDAAAGMFEAALADPAAHILIGLDESKEDIAREIDPAVVAGSTLVLRYRGAQGVDSSVVHETVTRALGPGAPLVRVESAGADATHRAADDDLRGGRPLVGDLEAAVADAWRATLPPQTIGPSDNFLDLGGNSLTAMRLIARLNLEFGNLLDVHDLYEKPTISEIAEEISTRLESDAGIKQGG